MELKEGTGPITASCPCGSFLEMYKQDKTFRVQTPESIDPGETNPNAPWVASPVADVGSSNLIVSRVLLQAHEMLNAAMLEGAFDKAAVILHLHACKEALLACETISARLAKRIDEIIKQITERGLSRDGRGRGLNPFPQVLDLELDCGAFLVQANRAIKLVSQLPAHFLDLGGTDSNFDYLLKRLSGSAIGDQTPLVAFVRDNATGVRYLAQLRNFHEHPKQIRTVIENFSVLPNGQIQPPVWYLAGQDSSTPRPIKEEVSAAIGFVRDIAEGMFIHLLMLRVSKNIPYYIEEVPKQNIVPALPIRYRLSIDLSKLTFTAQTSGS